MNIIVFGPQNRVIDCLRFAKFKSFGKFTNFTADGIAAELVFDRLAILCVQKLALFM
jgi:hypothetical protein